MKSILSHFARTGSHALKPHSRTSVSIRRIITEAALESSLQKKLTSRRPNIIYDYLSPTPSHLLNISLADFLPESCYPPGFSVEELELPYLPNVNHGSHSGLLPPGHHLVYFSPQVPSSKLLPDGTDPLQSPGDPFVRRMWAGGTLLFNDYLRDQPRLDNRRAYCREHIANVMVKGSEGNEKVFVNIERRIGYCGFTPANEAPLDMSSHSSSDHDISPMTSHSTSSPTIVEMRNIVFMREKPVEAIKEDVARLGKTLKRMPCLNSPYASFQFSAVRSWTDLLQPPTLLILASL